MPGAVATQAVWEQSVQAEHCVATAIQDRAKVVEDAIETSEEGKRPAEDDDEGARKRKRMV
jgi:hypothetical protein